MNVLIGFSQLHATPPPTNEGVPAAKIMLFDESTLPDIANMINASTTTFNYVLFQPPIGHVIDMTTNRAVRQTWSSYADFKGIIIKHTEIVHMNNTMHLLNTDKFPSGSIHWTAELLTTELGKVGIVFGSYI